MKSHELCRMNTYEKLDKILQKNQTKSDVFLCDFCGILKIRNGFLQIKNKGGLYLLGRFFRDKVEFESHPKCFAAEIFVIFALFLII